jgi:arylsulfatase A-like enzyme
MTPVPGRQPNILFVLTDDQGAWALGCAGNAEIRTPNLDRLATQGMFFRDFFCTSPVCSPARASIMTGRIPSQHGVHDWIRAGNCTSETNPGGRLIRYLDGLDSYPAILARNGYRCGLSGKWHLGDAQHPQQGFGFWEVHASGGGPYYEAPMVRNGELYSEPRYVTEAITDNALAFLETCRGDSTPFYLGVHYTAPHSPWDRDQHPEELYDSYYNHCPFESVPFEPIHAWQQNSAPVGHDRESRRRLLSGYYAAVTAWLDEAGLRETTLVLFTSDNGMNMGHHGVYGKGNGTFPLNMYDTSVKVPFIAALPGVVPAGRRCHELLSQYDVLPTVLEFAGVPDQVPAGLPGRSFAGLLRGETASGHERVVVFDEYGPVRMIRTHAWKYVHRYPYGPHELYDLRNDPHEKCNLFGTEAVHQQHEVRLRRELEDWFLKHVDPRCDGVREAVTGKGQVGLAGHKASGHAAFASDWQHFHAMKQGRGDRWV